MEKEFVPYTESLELKQLGFDEPCFATYNDKGELRGADLLEFNKLVKQPFWSQNEASALLFSQAFRWFREKYGLCGVYMMGDDWNSFEFNIWRNDTMTKTFVISSNWVYETYEEAELACLQKLIEIVKTK